MFGWLLKILIKEQLINNWYRFGMLQPKPPLSTRGWPAPLGRACRSESAFTVNVNHSSIYTKALSGAFGWIPIKMLYLGHQRCTIHKTCFRSHQDLNRSSQWRPRSISVSVCFSEDSFHNPSVCVSRTKFTARLHDTRGKRQRKNNIGKEIISLARQLPNHMVSLENVHR